MTDRQPTPGVHQNFASNLMEQAEPCPVCDKLFHPDDLCATDIELGICHAACLEGSAVVDLDTGEPSDSEIATFRYSSTSNAPAYDLREAAEVALGAFKGLGAEDGPGAQALRYALTAIPEKLPPTAYLRRGEKVAVPGASWGSMWSSDKDDPRTPAPQSHVEGDPANKAEAILRLVRKMVAAERAHAEKPYGSEQRADLDTLLSDLISFTTSDVDEALRIVRRRRSTAPVSNMSVAEAAKRYLAAIDSEPENDIWDTWDGKPAEGASKTASDASWADHGQKVEARLSDLRAALATTEGSTDA